MSLPVNASDLDINSLTFVPGPAKAGRNPNINLKYKGASLNIRVKSRAPGGLIIRQNEQGESFTLIPSLTGCDPLGEAPGPDNELGAFYNFLRQLRDKLVETAVAESPKWFGKQRSMAGVSEGLNPILNLSCDKKDGQYVPNGKYPPSFRVKVPVYDGRVTTEIINNKKVGVYATPENIQTVFPKGVEIDMVVSGSVYILAGGGFGLTWRLQKAQVFPPTRLTAADIFGEVADAEEDVPEVADAAESDAPTPQMLSPTQSVAPQAAAPRKRRVPVAQMSE